MTRKGMGLRSQGNITDFSGSQHDHEDAAGGGQLDADALALSATDRILGRETAGAGPGEEIACTAAGRALLDDADAAAQRTTLGLADAVTGTAGTGDNLVAWDGDGDAVDAGIAKGDVVTPSSTDTLTNKTFDANGTGNSLSNVETADIAAASKSGSDATLVTGTAGSTGEGAAWNADGDLVTGGLRVLTANTTIYVRSDGNSAPTWAQATTDGADPSGCDDPITALALLDNVWIAPGVTVTVQLADGTYTLTDTLMCNHPQGRGLLLQGNTTAGTSDYLLAQSGQIASTSGDDCILHVSGDVTSRFPVGSVLYLSGSTATPEDNNGYHYVTAVSYDGSKTLITLGGANSATQMPDPTESCDGSTQQVTDMPWSHKVKLYKATGAAVYAVTACSVSGLCICGNDAAGSIGVHAANGASSNSALDLDKVLIRNFSQGLYAAYGAYFHGPNFAAQPGGDVVVADCTASPGRGMRADLGGYLAVVKGTVIGCTVGTYAAGGSHIDMSFGTWRTNGTDSSPAVDTVGNDNSFVAG